MFFENDNFDIDIISVFYVDRGKKSDRSSPRAHHAMSFRITGNSVFLESSESLTAKDGDLVLVPPSSDYYLTNGAEKLYVIHFLCNNVITSKIKKFSHSNMKYMHGIFKEMYTVWNEKKPGYKFKCRSLFYKIISEIEEELALSKSQKRGEYLSSAMEYISEHFTEVSFTAEKVAEHLGISSVYLRKIFANGTGHSVKSYISTMRCERALELLASGYYTVGEAAERCGFGDVYYFSAFIKKQTGHSPKYHLNRIL